ncbi:MAG: glycoside hydrolase family 3 protein, partial [Elusimicrobiota bacterium]
MRFRCGLVMLGLWAAGMAPAGAQGPEARDPHLERMSLEQKVGQLFMIAIDSEIAAHYEPEIRAGRIGGAVLRWDRFTGEEAMRFSLMIQEWAIPGAAGAPFLIAADHEGGPFFTQRLYGGAVFPGNMALGAAGSTALTEEAAYITARELRALGIHMDFAPDLDINSNPDNPIIGVRSYGETAEQAAEHGLAALRGYRRGGILSVVKHFPGHGDTGVDSHLGLPVIRRSLAELQGLELAPFRAAVKAGADAVMPAHIVFSALGSTRPVTLSSAAIEGLLRGDMGFDGVVVSDSLDMGAIANTYSTPEAAVLALEAGCDILLVGKGDYPGAYERVLAAVKNGRVSLDRLERSVARILRVKERFYSRGLAGTSSVPMSEVGSAAHLAAAWRVAERSVTLLRDSAHILPLKLAEDKLLFVALARSPRFKDEADGFVRELTLRHTMTNSLQLPVAPDAAAIADAVEKAKNADVIVAGT